MPIIGYARHRVCSRNPRIPKIPPTPFSENQSNFGRVGVDLFGVKHEKATFASQMIRVCLHVTNNMMLSQKAVTKLYLLSYLTKISDR